MTILLFFCVFGISYSVYYGRSDENQEIETGQVVFTYSDVGQAGNGILLKDAMPTVDAIGKSMVGSGQYFDFFVTATTRNSKILYKLLIDKNDASTLADENVKIYLTQLMGSFEQEKVFTNFSNLKKETINNKEYYVLYETTLDENIKNLIESYRLRMWVKQDANDFENQFFSIKVDVYAYEIGK